MNYGLIPNHSNVVIEKDEDKELVSWRLNHQTTQSRDSQ